VTKVRELLEAIERVRERIERHGSKLSQNEMLTRYALVDPILRALGWDTEDPEQVVPEFSTKAGRADYALLVKGEPYIIVEAKPLGATLTNAAQQGVNYCVTEGIPYFVCTDGNRWVIYDTHKPVKLEEKVIAQAEISSGGDVNYDAARQLLALWRPAMPKVKVAKPPVLSRKGGPPPTPSGLSLQELRKQVRPGQSPPTSIRFPDGKQEDLRTWKDLLVAVAKWALPKLKQKGKLPLDKLIQRDGKGISLRDIGEGWKVETFGPDAKGCVRKAIRILEAAGVSADQVFVTLGEGQGRQGRLPKGRG
jgi:Predicted type IV restriction endonuclease